MSVQFDRQGLCGIIAAESKFLPCCAICWLFDSVFYPALCCFYLAWNQSIILFNQGQITSLFLDVTVNLPQIIIQSDYWKFQIFSRFIGVDWSLFYEDRFHH